MKKIFKVFIIVFIIFFVLFCFYYINYKNNHYILNGSIEVNEVSRIAIEKNDPLVCSKIRKSFFTIYGPLELSLQKQCYYETAMGLKNKSICEYISIYPSSAYKEKCYNDMAQILNDETICDLTGDDSGICNGDIAIQKKDAGVCERILDEYFRNTCYLIFNEYKRDISICDNKIKNPIDRDSCYIGLLYSSFKMGKQIPPTGKQFCEKIVNRDTYNICVGAYNDFYSDR